MTWLEVEAHDSSSSNDFTNAIGSSIEVSANPAPFITSPAVIEEKKTPTFSHSKKTKIAMKLVGKTKAEARVARKTKKQIDKG